MASSSLFYVFVLTNLFTKGLGRFGIEPKCSKFDFEEKLLEKLVRMEHSAELMGEKIDVLDKEFLAVKNDMGKFEHDTNTELEKVEGLIKELRWEEWGPWSPCTANCKNGVGERLQTRTRNKKHSGGLETATQTESRPCSSVQFAGCIQPQNGDQFYAVAYDYSHMLAQSTCTAISPGGYVNAVRRTCSNDAPDCTAVCTKVGRTCFNSLHVYSGEHNAPALARDTVEEKSLQMYKYNACGGGCGPNFCCCRS